MFERTDSKNRGRLLPVLFVVSIWQLAGTLTPAVAEVTRMEVIDHGTLGTYGGRDYVWVNAQMHGTVERKDGSTGRYRVPAVLMYPDRNPSGFGFVDVINTAPFAVYTDETAPEGKRTVYHIGDIIFSDYLRREGFSYLAVMSQRMVTYALGTDYGVIENGLDGYNIIADAARFVRTPKLSEEKLSFVPQAVDHVIAFGYSHTAGTLRVMMQEGMNRNSAGDLLFDGVLAGAPVGCFPLNNDETLRPVIGNPPFYSVADCEDQIPNDGKMVTVITESDYWRFPPSRPPSANHRQYELAGSSHIPPDQIDMVYQGGTRQNPISNKPFFKATLRNLVAWIREGKEPPASQYLEGEQLADGKFVLARDADGNVKGGVRLPHMPSTGPDGRNIGAPLGVYGGLDLAHLDPFNLFNVLGGTFEPFSDEAIVERYPSHEIYRARVEMAVDTLIDQRLLLKEDRRTYIKAAEYWGYPKGQLE